MTKSTRRVTLQDTIKSEGGAPQEKEISKVELDALKATALKVADLEKAAKEAEEANTALIAEMDTIKAAKLEAEQALEDIEKAKKEQLLTETVDLVKGLNLFEEDKVTDVAKYFISSDSETSTLILATLEKARNAIEEFGSKEHGTDLENKEVDVDKKFHGYVGAALKARKAK